MRPANLKDCAVVAAWTLATLIACDIGLGLAFRVPDDPRQPPGRLAQYFDFGRSIEAKLRRAVGPSDSTSAPTASAGWLDPSTWDRREDARPGPGRLRTTVYGQSFAFQIGVQLGAIDSTYAMRSRGGPASPVTHAYALWSLDHRLVHSDVAILGVLASSLRGAASMTGATWQFEAPSPYTYPRYRITPDGKLSETWPEIRSLPALRRAFLEGAAWRRQRAQFARDDRWFDPVLFDRGLFDHSVLARLLLRAWAQRQQRRMLAALHGPNGFQAGDEVVVVTARLMREFAAHCREEGTLPCVLLIEDAGYGDHLERAFGRELRENGVPYLATHTVADPGDRTLLQPDGHFSEAANRRIAAALATVLTRARAAETRPPSPILRPIPPPDPSGSSRPRGIR